jgi:hypothetical protein
MQPHASQRIAVFLPTYTSRQLNPMNSIHTTKTLPAHVVSLRIGKQSLQAASPELPFTMRELQHNRRTVSMIAHDINLPFVQIDDTLRN